MELSAEQVNKFLSDAILNSQIGAVVKKAVEKSIADLSRSYENPFDQVIKNQVVILIEKEVHTQYKPLLEARIKTAMEQWATDEVLTKIVDAAMERLKSRY